MKAEEAQPQDAVQVGPRASLKLMLRRYGRPVLDRLREHWKFFLLVALGILFVLFFWPGLYEYHWYLRDKSPYGTRVDHYRINRVTGEVQEWKGGRWR
jgi:hypothetical protein